MDSCVLGENWNSGFLRESTNICCHFVIFIFLLSVDRGN